MKEVVVPLAGTWIEIYQNRHHRLHKQGCTPRGKLIVKDYENSFKGKRLYKFIS